MPYISNKAYHIVGITFIRVLQCPSVVDPPGLVYVGVPCFFYHTTYTVGGAPGFYLKFPSLEEYMELATPLSKLTFEKEKKM